MADPVIDSRPRKTISGYNSDWVACGGILPVQYEISNTKFPTNSEDSVLTVNSISDNGGNSQLNVVGHPYSAGDYVLLSSFSNDFYDGVALVLSDDSANFFTINKPFVGSAGGESQNYFNNYATEVRVYAGIDSAHPHTAEDPIELIGTIKQIPDTDNVSRVDISQYVKTKLNSRYDDSQTSWPNDLNAWTDFYIEYREVFTGSSTSFVSDEGNYLGHAVYNTLQFKNPYGGNLYGFVFDTATYAPLASWLTLFENPIKFDNVDLELSIISDEDAFNLSVDGTLTPYSGNGYGVYRLPISLDKGSDYDVKLANEVTVSSGDLNIGGLPVKDNLVGLSFGNSGQDLYVTDDGTEGIFQYSLSTPYNLNTLSLDGFFSTTSLSTSESLPQGIDVFDSGNIYIVAGENNSRFRLGLSTPWDITTATLDDDESFVGYSAEFLDFVSGSAALYTDGTNVRDEVDGSVLFTPSETSTIAGCIYNDDGTKFWLLGQSEGLIFEYNLLTAYDPSTASYSGNSYDPGGGTLSGLDYNNNILYTLDQTNIEILSITIPTDLESETLTIKPND